ncbi:MAG: ABC transporter permease [Alphaproteobacteria bacterium]|jgi:putative hydroxymethylpyrimidine transport system permease protein|nr:ABC transporter permease [Alphaproteobacteria bacterium]MDP6517052.1 ABC transporter permease [Alphaproteobacteria bacterium]
MRLLRPLVIAVGLILLWQGVVWIAQPAPFILPGPGRVAVAWADHHALILANAATTVTEILLGLVIGTGLGATSAMLLAQFRLARLWLLPALVASQAVPVFALAPLLVLWLGYGLASKVAMATLIIYFPVTATLFDGLRRTDPGWLDLAQVMNARPLSVLFRLRLPAALPALASGLRVATAVAPIGAVVGEWVGSGAGLGYLMLHANGRMQIDLLFAALLTLTVIAVALYFAVDAGMRRAIRWQPDTAPGDDPRS